MEISTLRIHGPTQSGYFFIANIKNEVWDGNKFIGFGVPKTFITFGSALQEINKTSKDQGK